jgi:hypothetical protein
LVVSMIFPLCSHVCKITKQEIVKLSPKEWKRWKKTSIFPFLVSKPKTARETAAVKIVGFNFLVSIVGGLYFMHCF